MITLGRNDEADVLFERAGVSWDHAELRYRDGDWWLIDPNSTNGSYVNDERAHNARLKKGDVIRLGKKGPVMRFLLSAPKTSEGSGERPKAAPARRAEKRARSRSEPELAALPDLSAPARPAGHPAVRDQPSRKDDPSRRHSDLEAAPELPPRRSSPIPLLILGTISLASLVLLALLYVEYDALSKDLEQARQRGAEARAKLDEALDERASAVALAENNAQLRFGTLLKETERARDRLSEQLSATEQRGHSLNRKIQELSEELNAARHASAGEGKEGARTWKDIERSLRSSVLMIACVLEGKDREGKRVVLNGFGTGFFASSQGHIITNKHVVQPWKFREMALRIAREGIEIDESSYQLHAWRGGTTFLRKTADGSGYELDPSTGFSTQLGTLEMVRTAPDTWDDVSGEGAVQRIRIHVGVNGDLAVLLAKATRVVPIPAGVSSKVEKLDEVMVLGFPAGPQVLQKGIAETSPALGIVRKPEATLDVSAPMVPGNSGGPLIDRQGRVIGVCTQVVSGTETLGSCIRVELAMRLIHGGSW